jgi:hypothetical protein
MRISVVITGFATAALLLSAIAEAQVEKDIKIGAGDESSLYADIRGPGSVAAAQMAVADFGPSSVAPANGTGANIGLANPEPDLIDTIKQVCEGDKPYGDVEYADPGYQDDKKKRYPIDSEKHIRAAWSYISKPKNAGKYSADELKRIKDKIIAAWKDKIDPEGPPSAAPHR